jgi:uncharacterized membrane protein
MNAYKQTVAAVAALPRTSTMNKLLISIFDNEAAASAGLHALRKLHNDGDITLYATGVVAKDAAGILSIKQTEGQGLVGTGLGLAVGGVIGMLGGLAGVAVGAATGAAVGAVRDFWVAGVGLDFVEEADMHLQPGKAAVVAEIEEEWVTPANTAMEAAGGTVLRRARADIIEAQLNHDLAAIKAEINELESEASDLGGAAAVRVRSMITTAEARLADTSKRAQQRVHQLETEAGAKADAFKAQLVQAKDDAKHKVEARVKSVKSGYHARGAKLAQAWGLTREALAI